MLTHSVLNRGLRRRLIHLDDQGALVLALQGRRRTSYCGFCPPVVFDRDGIGNGIVGSNLLRIPLLVQHDAGLQRINCDVHHFVDSLLQRVLADLLQLRTLTAKRFCCEIGRAGKVGWTLRIHFVVMRIHLQDLLHLKVVLRLALA